MKRQAIIVAVVSLGIGVLQLLWGYTSVKLTVPSSDIIFSHALHAGENGIECLTCHPQAESSATSRDRMMPSMETCGQCHDAINDDQKCGMCHHNLEEPQAIPDPKWQIEFNHKKHVAQKLQCEHCHAAVAKTGTLTTANMPTMRICLDCHDGSKADKRCALCHGKQIALVDIHSGDWRHQHGNQATIDRTWCEQCHRKEVSCLQCHRGDNLSGNIHDLNYKYTHGLDAQSKEADCRKCHDTESFCDGCHQGQGRMPWRHSTLSWIAEHGRAAQNDVENCASCHDEADPTCARAGCHSDADGVRGTNPRFHIDSGGLLSSHGPWHNDSGYFCFRCHVNTHSPGTGFCGYCHGGLGD